MGHDNQACCATPLQERWRSAAVPLALEFWSTEGRTRREHTGPESLYLPAGFGSHLHTFFFFFFGLTLSKTVARWELYLINRGECTAHGLRTCGLWGDVAGKHRVQMGSQEAAELP